MMFNMDMGTTKESLEYLKNIHEWQKTNNNGNYQGSNSALFCEIGNTAIDHNVKALIFATISQLSYLEFEKLKEVNNDKNINDVLNKIITTMKDVKFQKVYFFYKGLINIKKDEQNVIKIKNAEAFVVEDEENLVVAYRGTEEFWDLVNDVTILPESITLDGREVQIHKGFYQYYCQINDCDCQGVIEPSNKSQKIQLKGSESTPNKKFWKFLQEKAKEKNIWITGHSLGGATGTVLLAELLSLNDPEIQEHIKGLYTYGQPKVGDQNFSNYLQNKVVEKNIKCEKIVNDYDPIARIPDKYNILVGNIYKDTGHLDALDRSLSGKRYNLKELDIKRNWGIIDAYYDKFHFLPNIISNILIIGSPVSLLGTLPSHGIGWYQKKLDQAFKHTTN